MNVHAFCVPFPQVWSANFTLSFLAHSKSEACPFSSGIFGRKLLASFVSDKTFLFSTRQDFLADVQSFLSPSRGVRPASPSSRDFCYPAAAPFFVCPAALSDRLGTPTSTFFNARAHVLLSSVAPRPIHLFSARFQPLQG